MATLWARAWIKAFWRILKVFLALGSTTDQYLFWVSVKVSWSCSILCDPLAGLLECVALSFSRGSSQPGIKPQSPALLADSLPAEPQGSLRILEWVAYLCSRGSFQPRNWTPDSCIAGRFFTIWAIREAWDSARRQYIKQLPIPRNPNPTVAHDSYKFCLKDLALKIDLTLMPHSFGALQDYKTQILDQNLMYLCF